MRSSWLPTGGQREKVCSLSSKRCCGHTRLHHSSEPKKAYQLVPVVVVAAARRYTATVMDDGTSIYFTADAVPWRVLQTSAGGEVPEAISTSNRQVCDGNPEAPRGRGARGRQDAVAGWVPPVLPRARARTAPHQDLAAQRGAAGGAGSARVIVFKAAYLEVS